MNRILSAENITIRFGDRVVLDGMSAQFPAGAMTAVIGSNGVGKTTFLKSIAKMVNASGSVKIVEDGKAYYDPKAIAYVPQLGALQTRLTVFEMVLLGLVNNLKWHVTSEQTDRVYATLEDLGLTKIASQPFSTLSGGQKQLVSMAQSLIGKPKVLLLDEPTSALDLRHQLIVMDLAKKYTREQNAVTLFVVHDLMLASRYGSQMLVLHRGKVYDYGPADRVLTTDMISEVYGVKAQILSTDIGFRTVIPITPNE